MDTPNQQPISPNQGSSLSKKQLRRLEKQQAKQARHAGQVIKSSGSRIVFWIVILAIIGFFVYAIAQLATHTPAGTGTQTDIAIGTADHTLGNPNASVQLVEYADFQCPGCAAFHPIVKQLMKDYADKVYYAYRYFPLPQHPHAKIMADAAEAASKQGKFFEMHDLIFSNQTSWTTLSSVNQIISGYATKLGLNTTQFQADMSAKATKDRIESDYQGGVAYGVNSTPSFFVNGVKIALPKSLADFKSVIDQAALSAKATTNGTSTTAN